MAFSLQLQQIFLSPTTRFYSQPKSVTIPLISLKVPSIHPFAFAQNAAVSHIDSTDVAAVDASVEEVLLPPELRRELNSYLIEQELQTNCIEFPCPDLLIRTSGELRLSNFLLWQLAYAELFFSHAHWPDFGEAEFLEALCSFQQRQRRYGGQSS